VSNGEGTTVVLLGDAPKGSSSWNMEEYIVVFWMQIPMKSKETGNFELLHNKRSNYVLPRQFAEGSPREFAVRDHTTPRMKYSDADRQRTK
jgi:hypothetical protein